MVFREWQVRLGVPAVGTSIDFSSYGTRRFRTALTRDENGDFMIQRWNRYDLENAGFDAQLFTGVFEVAKNAFIFFNSWAMPVILNSPLSWEQKGLLLTGLYAMEFGACLLARKTGAVLPENPRPPLTPSV